MISICRNVVIAVQGRRYRIPVPPTTTIEEIDVALSNTQRILCLTVYAYAELARSYSRDVADVLRRYNAIPSCREKYIKKIQKALDRHLYTMLDGRQMDFLREYADILYGETHSDLLYLQTCIEHLYGNDEQATPKACVHLLYNLVEYVNKAYNALMKQMAKICRIDFSKCFESWRILDVRKICEMLCEELGVQSEQDSESTPKKIIEQARFAFDQFITRLSNSDIMKRAQYEAFEELPNDVKEQFYVD